MIRFESFELDAQRRRLARGGEEIRITPKAFDLLTLLIEAAPRVVPKAELHERLWRGGIVSDATLVGLVKELRRALADRDRNARLIRTAHRIGYAFEASITRVPQAAQVTTVKRWLVASEHVIPLMDGENIVGRDPLASVWLDFGSVSRRHARIVCDDSGTLLEDLGSKNGTTLRDQRLAERVRLRNGDRIAFGQVVVRYREAGSGLSTTTRVRTGYAGGGVR
jgi:DNA-binding winged helix-turn-helix (wHTH) protein